jgi:hypothetical protein
MMKWAYQIEVNRARPVEILHGCEYMKSWRMVACGLGHDSEKGSQMLVLGRLSNPIDIFSGHSDEKKEAVSPGVKGISSAWNDGGTSGFSCLTNPRIITRSSLTGTIVRSSRGNRRASRKGIALT